MFLVGTWTYTHTIRRPTINDESPEVRTQIGVREYEASTNKSYHVLVSHRMLFELENFIKVAEAV